MKRTTLLLLLLVFIGQLVNAQNEANIWHFGDQCGLDFNTGEPIIIPEVVFDGGNANASIVNQSTTS